MRRVSAVKEALLPPEAIRRLAASASRVYSVDNESYLNVNLRWPVRLPPAFDPHQ